MKYLVPIIIFITCFLIILFCKKKNKDFTKILSIIYCILTFINIILPDSFIMSKDSEEEVLKNKDLLQSFLRWFNYMSVIVLPIASFFKNRTIRNIAVMFCLPVTILNIVFIYSYVPYFTSSDGRGLNNIESLSNIIKTFLINETFRVIWFSIILSIGLLIPLMLLIFEKHRFNYKDKKEILYFIITLILMLIIMVPIYLPQTIFGFTNLIFKKFGIVHFAWIIFMIIETLILIKVFKNKSEEDKYILCLILALVTLYQYNSMFSLTISFKRLPLQLCNLASYLIVIALITKNQHIFNFNLIVNVLGAFLAILLPDVDNKGIFNVWNMHFITEHTHVLIVPILSLVFKIFKRIDKSAIKDAFIGFSVYFIFCLIFGTLMNGIAKYTQNSKYEVNYLFMFDMKKAIEVLPFIANIAKIQFTFNCFVLYPIVQLLVYVMYFLLCIIIWLIIRCGYRVYDRKKILKV